MMIENGGIFVCKTRHLVQAGGAKVSNDVDSVTKEWLHICENLVPVLHLALA